MPTYDAVIVSTSPIALLEALAREGAGERVLVVDDNTRIGGAWDYGTIGGHRRVEMGAHILRHHPGCYAFLRSHLGLPLEPMQPAPRGYSCRPEREPRGTRYETWRWKLDYIGDRIAHSGLPRSWKRVEHDVIRPAIRAALMWFDERRGRGAVQLYPVGGTPALIDRIRDMVRDSSIEVRLGTRLNGINRRGDVIECGLGSSLVTTKTIVLSHQSRLDTISIDGAMLPPTGDMRKAMQLIFVVRDASPIACSFLEFNGHPRLRRVSDVTRYTEDYDGSHREKVIAVSLRAFIGEEEAIVAEVFDDLKQLGVISQDARQVHARWHVYRTTKQSPTVMERLRATLGEQIAFLETRDLAAAIEMYAPRWTRTIKRWRPAKRSEQARPFVRQAA